MLLPWLQYSTVVFDHFDVMIEVTDDIIVDVIDKIMIDVRIEIIVDVIVDIRVDVIFMSLLMSWLM